MPQKIVSKPISIAFVEDGKDGEDGKNGENGKDGVSYSLVPSASEIVRKKDGTYSPTSITCYCTSLKNGAATNNPSEATMQYSLDDSSWTAFVSSASFSSSTIYSNGGKLYLRLLVNSKVMDKRTISVVADGDNGVAYSIVFTSFSSVYNMNNRVLTTSFICHAIKNEGGVITDPVTVGNIQARLDSGNWMNLGDDSNGNYDQDQYFNDTLESTPSTINFRYVLNGSTLATASMPISIAGAKGDRGYTGPALRVSDWSKCTTNGTAGYQFYKGADNEPFKDIVVYVSGGTEYWFSCTKTHATVQQPKTTGDFKTDYWEGTTRQEIVATNVLLATYGKIDNLYTDDIRIGDWQNRVNPYFIANAGAVVTNFGQFDNISTDNATITNATITDADVTGTLRAQKYLQRIDELTFTSTNGSIDIANTENGGNYVQTILVTSFKGGSRTYNTLTLPNAEEYRNCFITIYNIKLSHLGPGAELIPLQIDTKTNSGSHEDLYNASTQENERPAALPVGQMMRLYSDGQLWWIMERRNVEETTGGGTVSGIQSIIIGDATHSEANVATPIASLNHLPTLSGRTITFPAQSNSSITVPESSGSGDSIDWSEVAVKIGNNYVDFDSVQTGYSHVADITSYVGGGTTITVSYNGTDGKYGSISDGTTSFNWFDKEYIQNHYSPSDHTHSYLPLSGGTMSGNILMDGNYISLGGGRLAGRKFDMYDGYSNAGSGYTDYLFFVLIEGAYFDNDIVVDGSVSQASDIRLKEKIGDLAPEIDMFADAPLFSFAWKSGKGKPVNVGTSAQYFQQAMPEVVNDMPDGHLGLDYNGMNTAGVITAAREIVALKKDAEEKDRRIAELERKLKDIMDKL